MKILLKIFGIIIIYTSILAIGDIIKWLMITVKEVRKSILNSTFNIHILIKLINYSIITIIIVIMMIFALWSAFGLITL